MKKTMLGLILISSYIFASNIFIINDRVLDENEKKFVKYLLKKKKNKVYPQVKSYSGSVVFEHSRKLKTVINNLKNTISNNIFETLNILSEDSHLNKNDKIIIFSNLYYKKEIKSQSITIDFEKKMPNDGFITSKLSPFKSFLSKKNNPNNKFKNISILVITKNQQDLKYINHMERFYYYFFKELGSKMKFYGNTGCATKMKIKSCDRLKDFFFSKANLEVFVPLENSAALQLIDKKTDTIDNVGADLSSLTF